MSKKRKQTRGNPAKGAVRDLAMRQIIPWLFMTHLREVAVEMGWEVNSCIPSSMVGQGVLAHYGIQSELVAVGLQVMNRKGYLVVEKSLQTGVPPVWDNEDPMAWVVGVANTGESTPTGWNGHLILETDDRRLVDATLPQASRPAKQMIVEPLVLPLVEPGDGKIGSPLKVWREHGSAWIWATGKDQDVYIQYERMEPAARDSYKQSKAWKRGISYYRPVVNEIVRRIDAALAEAQEQTA